MEKLSRNAVLPGLGRLLFYRISTAHSPTSSLVPRNTDPRLSGYDSWRGSKHLSHLPLFDIAPSLLRWISDFLATEPVLCLEEVSFEATRRELAALMVGIGEKGKTGHNGRRSDSLHLTQAAQGLERHPPSTAFLPHEAQFDRA